MAQLKVRATPTRRQMTPIKGRLMRDLQSRCVRLGHYLRSHALRSFGVVQSVGTVLAGVEIATRQEVVERLADRAALHLEAEAWKRRAAMCESRIAELEAEVASSRVIATDLRARLVCLHGKLATTAATARYQSFTSALESRTQEA